MNNEVGMASCGEVFGVDKSGSHTSYSVCVPKRAHVGAQRSEGAMYDVHTDVVNRSEVLPEKGLVRLFGIVYFAMILGMVSLIGLFVLKIEDGLDSPSDSKVYGHVNGTVAIACFITMLACTISYIVRVTEVTLRGFHWSARRKKLAMINLAQYISQTLNTLSYAVPNVIFMRMESIDGNRALDWMGMCRISLWNFICLLFVVHSRNLSPWVDARNRSIGRDDAIILDAPWTYHWPVFLLWAVIQGIIVSLAEQLSRIYTDDGGFAHPNEISGTSCDMPSLILLHAGVITGSMVVFQLLGKIYIYQGCKRLLKKPYNLYRGTNMDLRYHFLYAGSVGDFVAFSVFLLFWVKHNSCGTGNFTALGYLPPQLVMTALSAVDCILTMPVKPGRTIKLSMPIDQLEWLELPQHTSPQEPKDLTVINKFCFELSVKLWYWSLAVYAFNPTTQECHDPQYPLLSFHVAMDMFGFQHHEFIAEKGSDTRILIAWNDHTILMCFRGTYSATNVWTDLQFWRVIHPPNRGNYFLRTQPLVHWGFRACWERSKLNLRIVAMVKGIMDGENFDQSRLRMLVTGHSLGGALAVLASHDLATSCGIGNKITCYTYGAPRVGNHAFVREYNACVPNTWQVINDEDLIPSIPKFVLLFKHVGEKVIINGAGDMIVKPHAVEVSLYRVFTLFKRSIRITHHLLLNYRSSFVAVCEAQYTKGKALEGGMEAMEVLLRKREKLLSEGLNIKASTLKDLHRLGSGIWSEKDVTRLSSKNMKNDVEANGCCF